MEKPLFPLLAGRFVNSNDFGLLNIHLGAPDDTFAQTERDRIDPFEVDFDSDDLTIRAVRSVVKACHDLDIQ